MATSLLPLRPVGVRACATTTGHRKPEVSNVNLKGTSSSSNWWSPLFGWSAEPDYIDSENNKKIGAGSSVKNEKTRSDLDPASDPKLRTRGRLTEEKARQLRMMTSETMTFHDVMYHSAIASRLASDFSKGSVR